jgi:DNA modification methylase
MDPMYSDNKIKLFGGDVFECLNYLPKNTIQAVITSPTYWGKRNFTHDKKEFGSEKFEDYIDRNVNLFSSLLRIMKDDGSVFIIIQDSYMGIGVSRSHHNHWEHNKDISYRRYGLDSNGQGNTSSVTARHNIIKNKSLCGIPYRIAIKLVDMGFIWRQHIIWEKPNPMPENVKDRARQSAEYILHFTKSGKYKFNSKHIMVMGQNGKLRLDNQVWIASTEPKSGHTATFPSKIVKRLLLSVTDEGDTVFEPFLGSGTMLDLCIAYGRKFIGCDINKNFINDTIERLNMYNNLIPSQNKINKKFSTESDKIEYKRVSSQLALLEERREYLTGKSRIKKSERQFKAL